jgi:hypothetical protein
MLNCLGNFYLVWLKLKQKKELVLVPAIKENWLKPLKEPGI